MATLESILADLWFAARQLIKSPAFTVTAVITAALGIAINATMFSMVSALLMGHVYRPAILNAWLSCRR